VQRIGHKNRGGGNTGQKNSSGGLPARKNDLDAYRVQVIDRASEILDCFTIDRPDLSVHEISRETGLSKSTVHRILIALEVNRLIQQNQDNGSYRLGLRLFDLGNRVVSNIREVARPYMVQLMEETGETIHLAVLDGNQVLIAGKVDSSRTLRMASWTGQHYHVYHSAAGKALISDLSEAELQRILPKPPFKALTHKTRRTLKELIADLERVRRLSYSVDNEEYEIGLRCVGAPIRDHSGRIVAALSISGPTVRISDERIPELGEAVKGVAKAVSEALGAPARRLPLVASDQP